MMPGDLITPVKGIDVVMWSVPIQDVPPTITSYFEAGEVGLVVCTRGNKEAYVVSSTGWGWVLTEECDVVHRC